MKNLLKHSKLKEISKEEQMALQYIVSDKILQSYLENEEEDSLSCLRNSFLSIHPNNIKLEAVNCINAGIDVDVIMQDGIVKGYLQALGWLCEQYLNQLILYTEIIMYNKIVLANHIPRFKNRFNPSPLPSSSTIPVLLCTTDKTLSVSCCYEGIFTILEIPIIESSLIEHDLQTMEHVINDKGIKEIVCFIIEEKHSSQIQSNDLQCSFIESISSLEDIKVFVVIDKENRRLGSLQELKAENIIFFHSPLEVIETYKAER